MMKNAKGSGSEQYRWRDNRSVLMFEFLLHAAVGIKMKPKA